MIKKILHRHLFGHFFTPTEDSVGGHVVFTCLCGDKWSRGVDYHPDAVNSLRKIEPWWVAPTRRDNWAIPR